MAKQAKQDVRTMSAVWRAQVQQLEKFLLTRTEPPLAWLPKSFEDKTSEAIARRPDEVQEALSGRDQEDEAALARIDADIAAKVEQRRQLRLAREASSGSGVDTSGGGGSGEVDGDDTASPRKRIRTSRSDRSGTPPQDSVGNDATVAIDDGDDDDDILAALDGRQSKANDSDGANSDCNDVSQVGSEL
ncbi:unnamed protein product [Symbiodinium microadriaticum]|nr:unnamed protein product [Symbiodinium microadriaticum]